MKIKIILYLIFLSAIFFHFVKVEGVYADQYCGTTTCQNNVDRDFICIYNCVRDPDLGLCYEEYSTFTGKCSARSGSSNCPSNLNYCCGFFYGTDSNPCYVGCDEYAGDCNYVGSGRLWYDCCAGGGEGGSSSEYCGNCGGDTIDLPCNKNYNNQCVLWGKYYSCVEFFKWRKQDVYEAPIDKSGAWALNTCNVYHSNIWSGYIRIGQNGTYYFRVEWGDERDSGALKIDDEWVTKDIWEATYGDLTYIEGEKYLTGGWHRIELWYYKMEWGTDILRLLWRRNPAHPWQIIPARDENGCIFAPCSPPASCSLSLPSEINLIPGDNLNPIPLTIDDKSNLISKIDFSLNPAAGGISVCDISYASCPSGSYFYSDDFTLDHHLNTKLSAFNAGSWTIIANGQMDNVPSPGNIAYCTPQAQSTIIVTDQPSWSQFKGGDVITNAGINIPIPLSKYLIVGDPGIAIAGKDNFVVVSPGTVSEKGWKVENTLNNLKPPSYSSLRNKIPKFIPENLSLNRVDEATLINSGREYPEGSGYYYFEYKGSGAFPPFFITDSDDMVDIGEKKIILFVEGTDVQIEKKIRLTKGKGFFMVITNGNIIVDPNVNGPYESPNPQPDIEGIYFTAQEFRTGSKGSNLDEPLHVRGSVVALNKVNLQRNLGDDALRPGELFEFAPDLILLMPRSLSVKVIEWKEVIP